MQQKEVSYDELVNQIGASLVRHYGSVAEFTRHEDFLALGFTLNDGDKVQTYFAQPRKEGGKRKTKSSKVMVLLAERFLGRKVTVKTEVTKVQKMYEYVEEKQATAAE